MYKQEILNHLKEIDDCLSDEMTELKMLDRDMNQKEIDLDTKFYGWTRELDRIRKEVSEADF